MKREKAGRRPKHLKKKNVCIYIYIYKSNWCRLPEHASIFFHHHKTHAWRNVAITRTFVVLPQLKSDIIMGKRD